MVEKSSGDKNMRDAIAAIAGPRGWNENRESWLARTAHHLGITARTMKSVWYGDITDPEHVAIRKIRAAAEQRGRDAAGSLADQFETLGHALQSAGTNFTREEIDLVLGAARALRGLAGARVDGAAGRAAASGGGSEG